MEKILDELEPVLRYYYAPERIESQIAKDMAALREVYINGNEEDKKKWEETILKRIRQNPDCKSRVFFYSYLLTVMEKEECLQELLELLVTLTEQQMSWTMRYHIYWQIASAFFEKASLQTADNRQLMARLYYHIIQDMKQEMGVGLKQIPAAERNKNFVIVITNQFLNLTHGPTKTALDRCQILKQKMKKEIMLINTAELLVGDNKNPWYERKIADYEKGYLQYESIVYEDLNIPFFQCEQNMPNRKEMQDIINVVRDLKPIYIVNIGGTSILTDLCNELVPTVTIGTVPSDLSTTAGELQVIGRRLRPEDLDVLKELGQEEKNVIEGTFTSSLPVRKEKVSRRELHAEEGDFLCVVVGGRLNQEITDEFVEMICGIKEPRIKFIFIGRFQKGYEYYSQKYKDFREKAINIGEIMNVLGYLEQCDLYVNPIRTGGGTSVIEAMHEGLPVVTTDFGDGALGVGKNFFVKDYQEMAEEIVHYAMDRTYYEEKSQKAKLRAAEMLDTSKAFCKIMEEAERRLGLRETGE
ncbi:MAG: glycosyltransferase family 4 protein [Lachnospiraceae bacterium]|nr:glycosyltransferase family 4 protein [Lachnospiraceae bacterium]